jgi:hypothetical protein
MNPKICLAAKKLGLTCLVAKKLGLIPPVIKKLGLIWLYSIEEDALRDLKINLIYILYLIMAKIRRI